MTPHELLADRPHVQIVLSTNWARVLPCDQVRGYLPPDLHGRVIGATWDRIQTDPEFSRGLQLSYWQTASRYQQISRWVRYTASGIGWRSMMTAKAGPRPTVPDSSSATRSRGWVTWLSLTACTLLWMGLLSVSS